MEFVQSDIDASVPAIANKIQPGSALWAWERIQKLYAQYGEANYIGEAISVVSHSIQAAQLAIQVGNMTQDA